MAAKLLAVNSPAKTRLIQDFFKMILLVASFGRRLSRSASQITWGCDDLRGGRCGQERVFSQWVGGGAGQSVPGGAIAPVVDVPSKNGVAALQHEPADESSASGSRLVRVYFGTLEGC